MSLPLTSHLWLVTLGHADPLALKIVGEMVADLFGGEIGLFLAQDMVVFGSIVGLLDEQFARLSALEQISQHVFANLGWDEIRLPHPVFEGDTIYSQSEVLARRESRSRPNVGIVTVKTTGYN